MLVVPHTIPPAASAGPPAAPLARRHAGRPRDVRTAGAGGRPERRHVAPSRRTERAHEWFGTPVAAAKTLVWLCWVMLLASVLATALYLAVLGVLTVAP